MTQYISSVTIWINAFIPKDISGYTKPIPNDSDKTMIPGPFKISDCYHTDQRSFSSDINASARIHCEAKFELKRVDKLYKITRWKRRYWCDKTIECDCEDGETECEKVGSTTDLQYSLLYPVDESIATPYLYIDVIAAAHNPCSPSSAIAGDIDFRGKILIDLIMGQISFAGYIDDFPAFEAYVQTNDTAPKALFNEAPPKGNTVMDLPGPAKRQINVQVAL